MGNFDTKPNISYEDWEKVQTIGGLEIFKNKQNNQIAQRRIISIDPHFDLDDQLQIYQMREQNTDSLVRAFGAQEIELKQHSRGICSGHKKVDVLTERMPYRLNELPQLTFSECILFLRQSLRAYNKVFKSYGPIQVTKRMIGINYLGEVRCWVNQNWALNHPDHELPTLQSTKLQALASQSQYSAMSSVYDARYRDETQMVHNIVAVIEQKCEQGRFPQAFSEEIQNHSVSFRKLTLYLQDFIAINQLFIPPIINYETVCVPQQQPPIRGNIQVSRRVNQHQTAHKRPYFSGGGNLEGQNVATNVMNTQYVAQEQPFIPIRQQYSTPPLINNEPAIIYHHNPNPMYTGPHCNNLNYQPQILQRPTVSYTNPIIQKSIEIQATSIPLNQSLKDLPQATYNMASTGNTCSTNNNNNLWLKPESTYKPAQNQSNFSSSSYQYSMTNPSISGNFANPNTLGNYSFGGLLTNTDLLSRTQLNKPSSHTTLSNILGSTTSKYGVNNNQNRMPGLQRDTSLSGSFKNFNNIQESNAYNQNLRSTQPNARTYQQFKKEFSHTPLINETQNIIYTNVTKIQPTFSNRVQEGFTYSFDGRNQLRSKFPAYSTNTNSSTFNSYGVQTLSKPFTQNTVGMGIQGKYADQFNNLLGNLHGNQIYNTAIQVNRRQGENLFQGKKYKA